jgi:hypothetical protein
VLVVALIVILFPPLLIAFLLVMERVEEPLRRPASQREVEEFLGSASPGEVSTLAHSGIRRAMARWRRRRSRGNVAREAVFATGDPYPQDDPVDRLPGRSPAAGPRHAATFPDGDPADTARIETYRPPVR